MSEKNGSAASGKPDLAALRAQAAQDRADLGETMQALAAKADVKARAKEQVEHTKQRVKAQAAEAGQRARDAAYTATEKVRSVAGQAVAQAEDKAPEVKAEVRRNQVPIAAVLAGVAALVGVILIVRGRRR